MLTVLLTVAALAHPGADERLIPEGCEDVAQLFRRSAALSAESRLDEAEQEMHRAARCGADPDEVNLTLAEIAVQDARPSWALSLLEKIASADHPAAQVVRSDALAAMGQPSEAADARLLAIVQMDYAAPDLLMRTAQLLETADRLPEALAVVDEGLAMAPAASLQVEAIRLAVLLNPERALARLYQLPETAMWMQRRGEILSDLNRHDEARDALKAALELAENARSSRAQREQIATLTLAIEGLKR